MERRLVRVHISKAFLSEVLKGRMSNATSTLPEDAEVVCVDDGDDAHPTSFVATLTSSLFAECPADGPVPELNITFTKLQASA